MMAKKTKKEAVVVDFKVEEKLPKIEKQEEKQEVKIIKKEEPKISFDVWFFTKKIPLHHAKEIIWADFKSRGLSKMETKSSYDKALLKYGLKL